MFLLPKDILEEEIELGEQLKEEVLDGIMDLNDAGKIIRDLDKQYDFKGKSGNEIKEYAKKLRGY